MAHDRRSPGSLSSPDGSSSLDLYLDEVGSHPLLDPEEEERVARRARAGSREAVDTLVRSNLRFVVTVAKKYQNRGLSFPDLVQEGNVGLITAAEKFDPDRGVKFISYAVWWIRQSILASLAEQGRVVRLPLNRATELGRMMRARQELRQELGRDPDVEEIAEEADLTVSTAEMLQALSVAEVRLDAPVGENDESTLVDRFLVDDVDLEEQTEEKLLREHVARALRGIRPRDARVIRLYYGLQGEREHTLAEIGEILGITRERVRQLRNRGLAEIRQSEIGPALRTFAA